VTVPYFLGVLEQAGIDTAPEYASNRQRAVSSKNLPIFDARHNPKIVGEPKIWDKSNIWGCKKEEVNIQARPIEEPITEVEVNMPGGEPGIPACVPTGPPNSGYGKPGYEIESDHPQGWYADEE
jgi:hypothetical protein